MSDYVVIAVSEEFVLRQLHNADAEDLFHLLDANRNYLRKYLNWVDATTEVKHVEHFIISRNNDVHHEKGITFTIRYKERIIGCCSIHDWNHQLKKAALGYWISEEYGGRNIVTACVAALLRYGFSYLGLEKAELCYIPENTASARVAEKLGFTIEGRQRQAFFINGQIKDHYISGLLKTEWMAQQYIPVIKEAWPKAT